MMKIINDNSCAWINDLNKRSNIKTLDKDHSCDWLIIGSGYTGLSAARKLSELHPNQKIIIVDAQLAGEGASGAEKIANIIFENTRNYIKPYNN